ncbi:hypothetical protein G9A89_001328 [Geosiphon pyriformis]|nr:hypothetical protein G9A89_001328 [Geosiphon pyriformis]
MAYTPITKLDNFTSKEDDTQVWLNDVEKTITANGWNDAQAMQAILYFLKDTANSYSILQHIHLLYPGTLQDTVICTRDFESVESEANHAQAINLVMNRSSELNSKLKKFRPRSQNLDTGATQNPNFQNYLSLLVTPENATPNNQELEQTSTSNIPSATIMEDESLDAIFSFKLKKPSIMPLFSGATLKEKPITAIYTDVKIDGHSIKLILDNQLGHRVDQVASARIITANGVTKTPIGKIDDLPIEINGIIVPIKVLVMEATQYQALVDERHSELKYTRVSTQPEQATNTMAPLIDFEEEKPKPTWEAYQVLWADEEHNELPPILFWDNNRKRKQTNKLTWETDDLT